MNDIESISHSLPIEGVTLQRLRIMPTPLGDVLHGISPESACFSDFRAGFGEVYFSEVLPGKIKGWKRHSRQTQHFCVPSGKLKVVLCDGREDATTYQAVCSVSLGRPDAYNLLRIPVGVWYSFSVIGDERALICNIVDIPHDPTEGERLPIDSRNIPYIW